MQGKKTKLFFKWELCLSSVKLSAWKCTNKHKDVMLTDVNTGHSGHSCFQTEIA